MASSQRSVQYEVPHTSALRSSFSLTDRMDKVLSSLKTFSKNGPSHKGKEGARSISLFPDVFVTKANTEDSPTRLPPASWDGFFSGSGDSDARIVMPYLQFSKEKRLYHSPFVWSFDEKLARHISSHSMFAIKEASSNPDSHLYQIQPNREKIEKIREKIGLVFEMYYRLVFYNKIHINCSVEINKLKQLLQDIDIKIDAERVYSYENGLEELFTSHNIDDKVYEQYKHILESPIKEKFIPTLMKLKKEFYAMEYLSEQHKSLTESLNTLVQDINQTISLVYVLKKQIDAGTKLSTVSPNDMTAFEKAQKPQDLYNVFVDLKAQMKALANEASLFSKLRISYRNYLKITVLLEVYSKGEPKLKDLKKRLLVINNRLQKKVEGQNGDFYDLFRRATSEVQAADLPVEECRVDIKKLIEGEECLDKLKITEMTQHVINVEAFVRRAEIFCEELASNKNQKKVAKMLENSAIYIQQVEKVLRGIIFAREKMAEIEPIVQNKSPGEQTLEAIEKELRMETRDLAYQIKQGSHAFDLESWSSSKVMTALNTSMQHESMLKKVQKGNQQAVAFGTKKMFQKLAKVIRNRRHEKNKVYLSCKGRVEASLNIGDVLSFFKSKRLWQSIASPKAHMINIQSWSPDLKKMVHRRIYCNPQLESYILRILRSFVNSLAETPQKHFPSN